MFQTDVFSNQWCDIIFENREKNYGAYALRKKDARNTSLAFFISSIFFVAVASYPMLMEWLSPKTIEVTIPLVTPIDFVIDIAPKIKPQVKPKIIESIKPSLKQTIKYSTPIIDDDINSENLPSQEKLNTSTASIQTINDSTASVPNQSSNVGTFNIQNPDTVYYPFSIQQEPEFPGGKEALFKYLASNIRYTPQAKDLNISGKVFISFVVDKEGKVIDADVVRGIGGGLDQIALSVVNAMPKWRPGKANGNAVNVRYALPITFTLK